MATTLALVAAALSIAATPASARPPDKVTLSATPTNLVHGATATITATTNIAPAPDRAIYLYSVNGGNLKICTAATSCTMNETYASSISYTYVAEVREHWGHTTIATSNSVTVTWQPFLAIA